MIEYADRLADAMKAAKVDTTALAKALDMSYQGVKRVLDGKSKTFSATNNEEAARHLGVSSRWLSTGVSPREIDGVEPPRPWPFKSIPPEFVASLSPAELRSLDTAVLAAFQALLAARPGSDLKLGNVTVVGGLTQLEKSLVETGSFAKKPEKVK